MPNEIDPSTLELLERRLTENVTKTVRAQLFAVYAAVGVAVGATLTFVGYNMFSHIESNATDFIKTKIDEKTKTIEDAIARASGHEENLDAQFLALNHLQTRAQKTVENIDSKLAAFAPKAERLDTLITTVADLDVRIRNLNGDLNTAEQSIGSVGELSSKLAELANNLKELNELVKKSGQAGDASKYASIASTSSAVAESSRTLTETVRAQQTDERMRVWFQYFGVIDQDQAKAIAEGLRHEGFTVPGEERTPQASGLYEIRYYWDTDEPRAKALGEAVAKIIHSTRTPKIVDYTSWPKAKPKRGTIELWYGPAAYGSAD